MSEPSWETEMLRLHCQNGRRIGWLGTAIIMGGCLAMILVAALT
jgi:hypothetical protein